MNEDIGCPYCGEWQEVNNDDGDNYEENTAHQHGCSSCDKTFVFYTSISYSYEGFQSDCLNDSKHTFEPTATFPKMYTKMMCTMCDIKRNPTDEEKTKYNIPNIKY